MIHSRPRLPGFRFVLPMRVRYRDLDAKDHVNNAVYFTFFEEARTEYWMALRKAGSTRALDFIVARAECDYAYALRYRQEFLIGCRISRLGNCSFDMEYELWTADRRVPAATARTVQAFYDFDRQKTLPIPPAVRRRILEFEGVKRVRQGTGGRKSVK